MSYLVLARKWRPQNFDDLVGQEPTTRTLKNAIELDRVSHAIVLTGTRGVGKTTTARILAKALNCETGPTSQPCGTCSNCLEIAAGSNVDVLEIDGASNTHVEDIRTLLENVRYSPSKSKHKIYIIDEVHMLSKSAFNALLKTLEEPPPGVIFMFATTEPHKIPETILSRCQRFDLTHISETKIAGQLRKIVDAENVKISDAGIGLVARQADGSMRDALSALDRIISFAGTDVSDEDVASILGLTDRTLIRDTLKAFVDHDGVEAISMIESVLSQGFDSKTFLLELWGKVRDLMVLKSGASPELIRASDEDQKELLAWANELNESEIERWFDLLKRTTGEISRSEFPRYLLEVTFLRICKPTPSLSLQDIVERLEGLERRTGGSSKPTFSGSGGIGTSRSLESKSPTEAKTIPTPPRREAADESGGGNGRTQHTKPDRTALLNAVKRSKPAMAAILLQAVAYDIANDNVSLTFDEGSFYVSRAKDPDFQEFLTKTASKLFGGTYGVKIDTQQPTKQKKSSSASQSREREKEALEHPSIRQAVSLFDAKIEEIKPLK